MTAILSLDNSLIFFFSFKSLNSLNSSPGSSANSLGLPEKFIKRSFLTKLFNLLLVFKFDLTFWVNLILLSVFAMALGTSIYFYASTELGPGKASSFIFLVPLTAILFSMYFLREPIQISTIFRYNNFSGISLLYFDRNN